MKLNTLLIAALSACALTAGAFADHDGDHDKDDHGKGPAGPPTCAKPPTGTPCPGNTNISEKLARDYMKALAEDARQDEKGQAKLDRIWAAFIKAGFIPPGTPNPLTYEGSAMDMKQDAKLNEKLEREFEKAGVPFTSPIT